MSLSMFTCQPFTKHTITIDERDKESIDSLEYIEEVPLVEEAFLVEESPVVVILTIQQSEITIEIAAPLDSMSAIQ